MTETFQARMPTPKELAEQGIHAASQFSWTYGFKLPG